MLTWNWRKNKPILRKQEKTVPKLLINTLMGSKLTFPLQGEIQSANQQAKLQHVHHALIAEICDEEPLSHFRKNQ